MDWLVWPAAPVSSLMLLLSLVVSADILAELSLPPWACWIWRTRISSSSLRTLFLILPTWRALPAAELLPAAEMASSKPPLSVSAASAVRRAASRMAKSLEFTPARSLKSIWGDVSPTRRGRGDQGSYRKLGLHFIQSIASNAVRDLEICVGCGSQDTRSLLLGSLARCGESKNRGDYREEEERLDEHGGRAEVLVKER